MGFGTMDWTIIAAAISLSRLGVGIIFVYIYGLASDAFNVGLFFLLFDVGWRLWFAYESNLHFQSFLVWKYFGQSNSFSSAENQQLD